MLFSRPEVAQYIQRFFEPVWATVRPVPMIRIDFGNGTVLTRTLHGNIATYACTAEGQVLDILPGIYTPTTYLDRLYQFRLLANYAEQAGPTMRVERLRAYHQGQAAALQKEEPPPVLVNMDMSKVQIENRLKAVLVSGRSTTETNQTLPERDRARENLHLDSATDLANWKLLAEDTTLNETVRRRQIHAMLAGSGFVPPEQVTKRLYKEVLHADLDDPYLGLGNVLFASYPFQDQTP